MKVFNLILFCILLPISLLIMLMPSFASFISTVFFGIGNLITESIGIGSLEGARFCTYTQLIGASILVSLPMMLWGTFLFFDDAKDESKVMENISDFFYKTWWLFLIMEICALVGIYFWASSPNGLGGIETSSGTEGFFGWLGDFGSNFSNIYGWYVYPILHLALIGISLWLTSKAESNVGKIVVFSLLGLISLIIIPSVFAILLAVLSAFIIIVVAGVIILGGIAVGGKVLDDGKIHGHIDSNGDVTIDKW